jgi:hypothetical protein
MSEMTTEAVSWSDAEIAEAAKVWEGRTPEQVIAALDKGVRLTVATDAQRETFERVVAELGIDLATCPQKHYNTAKDIDRIYLASDGPSSSDPKVRELVRILKADHGMNANQVAYLVGIPPRLINGMYSAAVKAAKPAAAEAAEDVTAA